MCALMYPSAKMQRAGCIFSCLPLSDFASDLLNGLSGRFCLGQAVPTPTPGCVVALSGLYFCILRPA
uniref:Uncharacterized protein n=1 Tax=Anguilla anguilla TaxID=7936 RepID=A0A0E9W6F3_ANGAN